MPSCGKYSQQSASGSLQDWPQLGRDASLQITPSQGNLYPAEQRLCINVKPFFPNLNNPAGLPRCLSSKEPSCQCKEMWEMWVQSLGREVPSAGHQWRCRHREQTCDNRSVWRRLDEWRAVSETYALPCVRQIAGGNLLYDSESSKPCSVTT